MSQQRLNPSLIIVCGTDCRVGLPVTTASWAFMAGASILLAVGGCSSGVGTSNDAPAGQARPDYRTSIAPGIYAGEATCHFTSRNTVDGIVDEYSYSFNASFTFSDLGLPNPGVQYNPDNDQLELFGTVFDVTNRTEAATDLRYREDAFLVGTVQGIHVNGLITWLFTREATDAVLYQNDLAWSYRSDGATWNVNENCEGTLTR